VVLGQSRDKIKFQNDLGFVLSQGPLPMGHGKDPKIDYVAGKHIRVAFSKPWLADEKDVVNYLNKLKKAMMKEIEAGKRIQI